jgi:hypothetical protein
MTKEATLSDWQHGEELFSAKVKAGTRTYFIDVRRSATGTCPKDAVGDS